MGGGGERDAAFIGKSLQAMSDIDAIALDVVTLDNHVA